MVRLKRKFKGCLICALIVGWWVRPIQAQERVVLLQDTSQPSTGLAYALRIQLTDVAELDVREVTENPGVSSRVQVASELAQADDVLVVAWAEPAVQLGDGSSEAVLYVVGHKQGRALLEIVRVPGGEGPDVERSLALKLRELVDEIRHNREQAAASEVMLEPAPEPEPELTAAGWGPIVAAGLAVGTLSGSELGQWGLRADGGVAFRDGALRLSGLVALSVFPSLEIAGVGSRVRFYEFGPALLGRAQWREPALWLGLHAGPCLSFIQADGENGRARGEKSELVGAWIFGFDIEVPLSSGVALAASVDLQTRFPRQYLTVAGDRVVDLGRLRPMVGVALTWSGYGVR